ncbi:PAAR domain-containing protein, partial [Xenorhabdus eapokensis]|uniref:PAAR domain-containing protein n=1 Tax=Xenorhabdus eapokensis TaxID=1873482 RepID=UPI000A9EFA9F
MGLGDDIVTRIARVGATHAVGRVMPPSQPRGPAAAREGDIIQHSSFLGALAGVVVGALIGAAVFAAASAVIVGTGGLATAAVLALGTAGTMALGGFISDVSAAVTNMVDSIGSPDGAISQGSPNVLIEGKAAARSTVDLAACSKHPPPLIAQGSESVFINGQPAARKGDKLVCGATIKSGAGKVFIGSGQGTYLEIEEEFSGWQRALLIAVEFVVPPSRGLTKGIGKLFTKTGRQTLLTGAKLGAQKAGRALKGRLICAKAAFKANKGVKRFTQATKKFFTGDPIDVTTGSLFDQRTEFELGQTIPLTFTRSWSPGLRGLLGENWLDNFSETVIVTDDRVELLTLEGASLHFALPRSVDHSINPDHPEFTLSRQKQGFVLTERNNPVRKYFTRLAVTEEETVQRWLLTEHRDRNGNTVRFHYNDTHQLEKVTHSDGPELRLFYREDGLLADIRRTDNGLNDVMICYGYHVNGWLAEADSTQQFHLFYDYNEQGLISRWTDGDQTAVDYAYDTQGRCIHSIGSGGFYPVQLTYEPGITRSTTPQGHTTTWHYNDQQQVTQVETPCGHVTRYDYDEWGNLRHQILPAGQTLTLDYLADTGLVTQFTDATGATWQYHYDEADRLISMTDPLGRVWWQQYDNHGNADCFIAPDGNKTTLMRNEFGLVIAAEDTEGYKR